MAKLHFFYGTMGSSKSLDLIRANYNYKERSMQTIVLKPVIDTRDGTEQCVVKTRAGDLRVAAEFIPSQPAVYRQFWRRLVKQLTAQPIAAIFVDEAQFLSAKQVEDLWRVVHQYNVPVLCYGLKADFRSKLFTGSKRLLELADDLQEIRSICHCGRRAKHNARVLRGKLVRHGQSVIIGDNVMNDGLYYVALCNRCYYNGRIN